MRIIDQLVEVRVAQASVRAEFDGLLDAGNLLAKTADFQALWERIEGR